MWSAAVESIVFLTTFTSILGSKGVIFDVTTVYDVSNVCRSPSLPPIDIKGRVHVRTNAWGLSVNGIPESIRLLSPNLSCNPVLECNWKIDGWRSDEYINVEEYLVYPFHDEFKLMISTKRNWPSKLYVFFTTGSSKLRDEENLYVMRVKRYPQVSGYERTLTGRFYSQCTSSKVGERHGYRNHKLEVKDRDGSTVEVHCNTAEQFTIYNGNFTIYVHGNTIGIERPGYSDYSLTNIIRTNYISVYRTSVDDYDLKINIPDLSTKAQNSQLTSPLINTDRICLVLVVHYGKEIHSDQLQILTEDMSGVRRIIYTVHDAEVGWSVIRINESLQTSHPIKIIIKTLDDTEVKIRLTNTCDADGENVEILSSISHDSSLPLSRLPIQNVHPGLLLSEPIILSTNESNDCKNGGVMTSVGCACPPGFMGTLCELGCGQNRFGQDCGGVCSFRTKGCRGVALCSPFIECACAPGYMGDNCNTQCSPGTYGNNCFQQCGHCLSNKPCDIYTGSCDECEVGYLTPQCSEAYVYYSLKPTLSSDDYGTMKVSFNPQNRTLGYGTPKIYQIQYKEVGEEWRTYVSRMMPSRYHGEDALLEDEVEEVIENLKDGVMYEVRVLFMDANLNKYDGELVQISKMVTKCDIPDDYDYNVQTATNTTSLTFSWTYNNMTDHWCPVESYEVSWEEDWLWLTAKTQDTTYTLTDFFPDSAVKFKVRANTSGGFAPFSEIVTATTRYNDSQGSSVVRGLRQTASHSYSVQLSWQAPIATEPRKLSYTISYKCVNQLACSPGCKDAVGGELTQEDTEITLSPLLPFTQYLVTVTPEDGLPSKIYVGTSEAEPTEIPGLSNQSPIRTNTSLTVFWTPATVCSSHLTGYNYQLIKESDGLTIVDSGFTTDTSASFKNLTATTNYIAKIYVVTIAGWNTMAHLSINTSTSAKGIVH